MMKMIGDFAQRMWGSKTASPESQTQYFESKEYDFIYLENEEKRQATRINVDVPVWYRQSSGVAQWNLTTSRDYSSSGIRLVLLFPLAPGSGIEMKIKLPEVEKILHMTGKVVWVAQTNHRHSSNRIIECGVEFDQDQKYSRKDKLVYLIADQLCQFGLKATKHFDVSAVRNINELKDCYKIVYQGYLARKYCQPNKSEMFYHYYSFLPESRTFHLRDKTKILGTISLIPDSPCGLPMDKLFSKELNQLRHQGRKLAEVTLLALDSGTHRKRKFSLTNFNRQAQLFRLFKIMYEYAHNVAGVTDLIIGVHPKHKDLYRYLKFRPLAAVKSYSGACGNLALPLHLDLFAAKNNYSHCLQSFFCTQPTPERDLKGNLKIGADEIRYFLLELSAIWPSIPAKDRAYFFQCYPELSQSSDFVKKLS